MRINRFLEHKNSQISLKYMNKGTDFGVYLGKDLIATVQLDVRSEPWPDTTPPYLEVSGLEIKEKFRGKGYGKEVLDLIKNYAISEKCKSIQLNYYKSINDSCSNISKRKYSFF